MLAKTLFADVYVTRNTRQREDGGDTDHFGLSVALINDTLILSRDGPCTRPPTQVSS
jgi:hypothetical protein